MDVLAAGDIGQSQAEPPQGIEVLNLVGHLPEEWLKEKASEISETYKRDKASREPYMERRAKQIRMFCGLTRPKSGAFKGETGPHLPILSRDVLRLHGRVIDQIAPPKGEIVTVNPVGQDDDDRAKRVSLHMNWQIRQEISDWRTGMDATVLQALIGGSAFRRVYRDLRSDKNRTEWIATDDFVVPYSCKSTDPMMADVPHKTYVQRYARHELEAMERDGELVGVAALYSDDKGEVSTSAGEAPSVMTETVDKAQGVEKPQEFGDGKRRLLEHHCWMRLPVSADGKTEFGDQMRAVTVTLDEASGAVLRLVIREYQDPKDQIRWKRDMAMGKPNPRPVKMSPVENFVHYGAIPNPEGFYYLGIGYLVEGENEVADIAMSSYLDAAMLANVKAGFINRMAKMKRGELELEPGKLIELEPISQSIGDSVEMIEFNPPDASLLNVIRLMSESADGVSSAAEILSGQADDRATATGIKIQASMAMSAIAVITQRLMFSEGAEFQALARLNSVYLDMDVPFKFATMGPMGPQQVEVTRQDYLADLDIEFLADPRMATGPQKVEEADRAVAIVNTLPVLAQNPQIVFSVAKRALLARGLDREAALMGEPPGPPEPPQPKPQPEENAGFLTGADSPVHPDDDDAQHLVEMEEFEGSPAGSLMDAEGKTMFERHRRAHAAKLYLRTKEEMNGSLDANRPGAPQGVDAAGGNGSPVGIPPGATA